MITGIRQSLRWPALGICLVLCLLLTACADLVNTVPSGTRAPLAYYTWLQHAEPATLAAEQQRLQSQASTASEPVINLVQRALLTSVPAPDSAVQAETALGMLDIALRQTTTDSVTSRLGREYLAFGQLWHALLDARLQATAALAGKQSDSDRIQALTLQVNRLERQIQALTTIEQHLIEREQPQVGP